MKKAEAGNMTIHHLPTTKQNQHDAAEKGGKQKLAEIIDERNRLIGSVEQQPTEIVRDIAILAVAWAMHEVEVMERQHQAPSDLLSGAYGFRIIGLADGQYGTGMAFGEGDDGPQMFDTSTRTLVSQMRDRAKHGASQ